MNATIKYVGLDVHAATTVSSVRDETGRVRVRSVIATEATALQEFVRGLRGSVHVAFEEGTQAQWLYGVLEPWVDRIVVCDRRGERRGPKADQSDADRLSHRLRVGDLRPVYHGRPDRATLQELTRTYVTLVQDSTRVMQRLKALYRARAIPTPGQRVYGVREREAWMARLTDRGARFRAEIFHAQLDALRALRPRAKAAMLAEARRDPVGPILGSIPGLGPVRVALILATMKTPWRFRSKRNLWAYAGFGIVTWTSAEHRLIDGRPVRRPRAPLTRGLNPNHNPVLKDVFKGAATTALSRPGPLRAFYEDRIAQGMRPSMARLTVARKLAALTLHLWKKGERYDPTKLTTPRR